MAKLMTKRNIGIVNLVLSAVFLITLAAVAFPFVKKEPTPSLFSERERRSPRTAPPPEPQELYVCPRHPEVTSSSPGKCPQCDSGLENRLTAIVRRNLFDAGLKPVEVVKPAPVQPLKWDLVGVTKIGPDYVAVIRDKTKRAPGGFTEYMVRVDEEVPGYFGVTIVSITPTPPAVKYNRAGVGVEELKMAEAGQVASGTPEAHWVDIVRPVPGRVGYLYVVKYRDLQQRIPSAEAYRGTFGLEPNMVGTRANGLKITSLSRDNLVYAAGLRKGDLIQTINGKAITDEASALRELRAAATKGFSIQVGILRGRNKRSINYTLLKK